VIGCSVNRIHQRKKVIYDPVLMVKMNNIHRITGFLDFSIVWYSREHDVSETGSVPVLR
jgi:hypothetical protein